MRDAHDAVLVASDAVLSELSVVTIDSWAEWARRILEWVLCLAILVSWIVVGVAVYSLIDFRLIFLGWVNFVDGTVGLANVVRTVILLSGVFLGVSLLLWTIYSVIEWHASVVEERRVIASWRAGDPRPFTKETILYLATQPSFRRCDVGVGDCDGSRNRSLELWQCLVCAAVARGG